MNIDLNKYHKDIVFSKLNNFIDNLIDENAKLKRKIYEYSKDEEVAKLLSENHRLTINSLHILSENEEKDARVFGQNHWEKCKGNTRYILERTVLGMGVAIQCTKCNETKNITDVSMW